MSIQVRSNDPVAKPEAAKAVEAKPEGKPAATLSELEAKAPEQKASAESETTETEVQDSAKPEESETNEESDPLDEGKEKTAAKKKSGFQRRIDKLNARYAAKEQEVDYWRQQALKGATHDSKQQPKVDESKPGTADGKPKPDSFDTHAEFVEALTDWKTEQKLNERDRKSQQQRLQTDQERLGQSYAEKRKAFTEKSPDFDEVMEAVDDVPLPPALREIILTSDNGPELAYELAKNREEFERISKLSPLALAREIGKLESRLSAKTSESKTEQKTITKAPKPIDPVNAGGKGTVTKAITDPSLSQSEYEALRREQMKRRQA